MARPLYPDDLVASVLQPSLQGSIEKTYADVETHDPLPDRVDVEDIIRHQAISQSAFDRFLRDGIPPKDAVLTRWIHSGQLELMPESSLTVLDRSFLNGDVVKREPNAAMSGIVLNTVTRCTLQPMCTFKLSKGGSLRGLVLGTTQGLEEIEIGSTNAPSPLIDIPVSELTYAEDMGEDDLVIYKEWIGKVETIYSVLALQLSNNTIVEVHEDTVDHIGGSTEIFTVGDIVRTKKGDLRRGRWIYGQYHPNIQPIATVVQVRPTAMEVMWLQRRIGSPPEDLPEFVLERDDFESPDFQIYRRSARPSNLSGEETVSYSDIDVSIGSRVRFRDLTGACAKYDGSNGNGKLSRIPRTDTLGYDMNTFDVTSMRSEVIVRWQDLSITKEDSIALVPDSDVDDEHAAWPGEIAHTLDVSPVPDMPGVEQPSKVGVVQSVNSEERLARIRWCPQACVHYSQDQDSDESAQAGIKHIVHATVGLAEGEEEERSLYDLEAPAALNVRRGDIVMLNRSPEANDILDAGEAKFHWLGEIVEDRLDGTLLVRLGACDPVVDIVVRREESVVAIRSDGTDDDIVDDEAMDHEHSDGTDSEVSSSIVSRLSDALSNVVYQNEDGEMMDVEDVEDEDWESEDDEMSDEQGVANSPALPATDLAMQPSPEDNHSPGTSSPDSYYVLDSSVASDHHYATSDPGSETEQRRRVQREHKILQKPGAIPGGVYVRTWESRLDLLRILFVGPSDTPYSDVPFVVDMHLPENYPYSPPKAFFHSWSGESGLGGVGRVNPNLYEDGAICLSLLGTWSGNQGESWSHSRSTVLQVIVSVLGLVLVKEPYFNEAGYEHLAGLEASKRASALYSERTFLRARSFAISAIAALKSKSGLAGLKDLEEIVDWLYLSPDGPQALAKIGKGVQTVLQQSEAGTAETDGLTVMSKGACISLRRVYDRLEELLGG